MRRRSRFVGALLLLFAGVARGQQEPATTEGSASAPAREERSGREGRGLGGPGMTPPGYSATWYPSRSITHSTAELGFFRQNLSGAFPVWKHEGDLLLATAGVRNTLFSTDAILPDTGRPFPNQLWNLSVGMMYLHKFDNGWSAGLSASIGSASDRPFNSLHELNGSILAFLQTPAGSERDSWMFALMYSPTGNLPFPIPGIAYNWKPSDEFQASIGLPFSIKWKPIENLALTFSYIPVTNINARATYTLQEGLNVYAGFEWLNEAYFLADREDHKDRFMALEKRLLAGMRWDAWKHLALDVNAGYAFDRYYGEGDSQFSDLRDRVDVRSGAFVGASLLVKW